MNEKLFSKFLEKAKLKFGDKFDYSKVDYVNGNTPVTIICPIHGEFQVRPTGFLQSKHGCRKCSFEASHKLQKKTTEEFIKQSEKYYGKGRYLYNKVNYVDSDTKVTVTCPIHGDFNTRPADFIRGHGCPKCKNLKTSSRNTKLKTLRQEDFIDRCINIYGNIFDYSKVIYVNNKTKVLLHNNLTNKDILVFPYKMLQGDISSENLLGIASDRNKNQCLNTDIFIQRAKLLYGDKYSYTKSVYKTLNDKIVVTCKKHGDFITTPGRLLYLFEGCPICSESKGEKIIHNYLTDHNYNFNRQYKIQLNNKNYFIDFYLLINGQQVWIEYNGIQHYKPVDFFGGIEKFKLQTERDNIIRQYCLNNDIILLEYKYDLSWKDLLNKLEDDLQKITTKSGN